MNTRGFSSHCYLNGWGGGGGGIKPAAFDKGRGEDEEAEEERSREVMIDSTPTRQNR